MKEDKSQHTNSLIHETSPYLLQHAHNPVDWKAWNDQTLGEAKAHDKLLLISIGYAACHWCHVMEHESFEDEAVAKIMNTHFINIKVDREERPDIDQIYMDACQLMNGNGGWPLNAIALPDGRPIFAGTYFKKEDWKKLLIYFGDIYPIKKEELEERANQIQQGVQSFDLVELNLGEPDFKKEDLDEIWENWKSKIDYNAGGRIGAPKFPMPSNWEFLLKYTFFTKDKEAERAVVSTLDNMMMGGIYDHVGGGFARYSVDGIWKVPHFEKMLYDNGQLVSLYAQAYAHFKNPEYKTIVEETITWLEREMTDPSEGFYASLDADSEGVEGKFYVWDEDEINEILSDDAAILKKYWSIESDGNWEEGNILYAKKLIPDFCKEHNLEERSFIQTLNVSKAKLLKTRNQRIKPGLDDKILTSWNALMLKGLIDAYRYLQNENYLNLALKNAHFIIENQLEDDGRLNRNYKNGTSTINGFLEDYSFTIEAFIALYEVTGDVFWLNKAKIITDYTIQHFHNANNGMFYYTSDIDRALIARKIEASDNVIPSSNSSMGKSLFLLSTYFENSFYKDLSLQMLQNMKDSMISHGSFYSNWASLMLMQVYQAYEVVISGKDAVEKAKNMQKEFLPQAIFAISIKENDLPLFKNRFIKDRTNIYVCKNKTCKMPVEKEEEAINLIYEV